MNVCVTGGSSGIGRAVAEDLAGNDGTVFVNYHSDDSAAKQTADAIRARGATAVLLKADLGQTEQVRTLAKEISSKVRKLDVLVHCATATPPGRLVDVDPAALDETVRINGLGLVHVVRELLPLLRGGSSVVYVSSRGARQVLPSYGSVGITKALGEHAVRYLAKELAPLGVRVNTISFGSLDTPAFRRIFPNDWQKRLVSSAQDNPMGRALDFSDVTAAVRAITDPALMMLQGQTVTVDGGGAL